MATSNNSEEFNIVLNVLNKDKIDQARTSIAQEEQEIRRLNAALMAGQITQDQFAVSASRSAAAIGAANAQIRAASGGFNPRSLLEASRAIEDAQYGFAGIVNNIPSLVQALGGGAGLAGAASLAAIAINQVVKNWDSIGNALGFDPFKPTIDGLERLEGDLKKAQTEFDKLKEKTHLSLAEAMKFNDLKVKVKVMTEAVKTQHEVDASLDGQSEVEQKRGEGFRKAVNETGGKSAYDAYKDSLNDQKNARGEVYNHKTDSMTGVDDAARDNWQEALHGNEAAIRDLTNGLKDGNVFKTNLNDQPKVLTKDQQHAEDDKNRQKDIDNERSKDEADKAWKKQQEEDRLDKEAEEHARRQHDEGEANYNKWQYDETKKRKDEDMNAQLQDRMGKWRKDREDGQKTSQTFDSGKSFHDSLQQAVKGPDKDPTQVEMLAVEREIRDELKKSNEAKQQQGPARAG